MATPTAPSLNMAKAMWSSGIAQDRNNPHQHKDFAPNALKVLNRRYVMKDLKGEAIELPEQIFPRVAHNLAQADLPYHTGTETAAHLAAIEQELFDIMDQQLFLPNSPTLMNAGARLQQLSACFVLP